MRIVNFKVENYKSYNSSEEVIFLPGFNVIIGKNNSGKSALLQALSIRTLSGQGHRSLQTLPSRNTPIPSNAKIEVEFQFEAQEALDCFQRQGGAYIPVENRRDLGSYARSFLYLIQQGLKVNCQFYENSIQRAHIVGLKGPLESDQAIRLEFDSIGDLINPEAAVTQRIKPPAQSAVALATLAQRTIYQFSAERLNIGRHQTGQVTELDPNAQNLPQVLHSLQTSNPARFKRYKNYVHSVFPEILDITIPLVENNTVEIKLWEIPPETERDDLAVSLKESGTGIGQVLAMLYVLVTSDVPRPLIIDEPQSFLHPGAVHKLFDIFRQHTQHQYIVSTHSPSVIAAADAQNIVLVRKENMVSHIRNLDRETTKDLWLALDEVGARLSDVFGADHILWAEGPTEERCFPLILRHFSKHLAPTTKIVGVRNTGDFEGRDARVVAEIYQRLSEGYGIIPPALGFVFDQEIRTEKAREELERVASGLIHLLPRRMYENYLLHPDTIASLMSSLDNFRETPVSSEEITQWISENGLAPKYIRRSSETIIFDETWLRDVDGANLLKDLFKQFSEARYEYDKVRFGEQLTDLILHQSSADFEELADWLESLLNKK